jgi:hypothetical protein
MCLDFPRLGADMRRLSATGTAFRVNPRFVVVSKRGTQITPVLVDGFEAGYVWDTKSTSTTTKPNTRRPLKDGFHDHSQNCVEYVLLKFGPSAPTKKQTAPKDQTNWRVYMPMGEHSWMA